MTQDSREMTKLSPAFVLKSSKKSLIGPRHALSRGYCIPCLCPRTIYTTRQPVTGTARSLPVARPRQPASRTKRELSLPFCLSLSPLFRGEWTGRGSPKNTAATGPNSSRQLKPSINLPQAADYGGRYKTRIQRGRGEAGGKRRRAEEGKRYGEGR